MEKKEKSRVKFYILLGLLIISISASIFFHFYGKNLELFILNISQSKFFISFYMLLFIISSFISIPFLTFLGARIFSFNSALVFSVIGNMISAVIMFYLVRWLGRDYVKKSEKNHPTIKKLRIEFKNHPFKNIILLRLFFLLPPEVANVLGGLSDMSFEKYFFSSLIGVIPMTLFSVLLIKSYQWGNHLLLTITAFAFLFMLIFPMIYFVQLRKVFLGKYHKHLKSANKLLAGR